MQTKALNIPFDYNSFLISQKIVWEFSNKKFIKSQITYTILGVLILAINLSLSEKPHFSVGIGIISGYLFYILLKWSEYYERRLKFFNRRKVTAARFRQESLECTFTLSDNEIEYSDNEKLYKLNWSLFNPYLIFKDTILIIAKDSGGILFTIGRNEIGDVDFEETCTFLKEKIGMA